MCTKGDKVPCIFDNNIISCRDIISSKTITYTLDEQDKIPYLDTYKKTNITILIIKILLFLLLFLICYFFIK